MPDIDLTQITPVTDAAVARLASPAAYDELASHIITAPVPAVTAADPAQPRHQPARRRHRRLLPRVRPATAAGAADGRAGDRPAGTAGAALKRARGWLIPLTAAASVAVIALVAVLAGHPAQNIAGAAGTTTATVSPAQRAAADAASLLAAFRPPPGATRTGPLKVSALDPAPDVPASPDVVTRTRWYLVPGKWQAVYTWIQAHPPAGFTLAGSGTSATGACGANCVTDRYAWYSRPPVPGVLTQRSLGISVADDGSGWAAVRVDAADVWVPARPAGERIPATAHLVTITPVGNAGPITGALTGAAPVTITDPAAVARIAAVVDGLPVFPPGWQGCAADQGQGMRLTFRAAAGGPVLAVIQGDTTGCGSVSVTINGRQMLALGDASTMQRQVLAIAGAHWPGVPVTSAPGFAGYKWTVATISHDGKSTPVPARDQVYLAFAPNGQFGANDPVNFHSGKYEVTPGGFTTSGLIVSAAGYAGRDPVMLLAIDAISAFGNGTRAQARVSGDTLTITVNGYTLIARRAGTQANWPAPHGTPAS